MSSHVTLATNGTFLDPRFTPTTTHSSLQANVEFLVFSGVRKEDATTYSCIVRDSQNMNIAVISRSIFHTVLYFPFAIYPICIPDGPFTALEGATVNMSCTTEKGSPEQRKVILPNFTANVWTYMITGNEQTSSLRMIVTTANQG